MDRDDFETKEDAILSRRELPPELINRLIRFALTAEEIRFYRNLTAANREQAEAGSL